MTTSERAQDPTNQRNLNHTPELEAHPEKVEMSLPGITAPAHADYQPQRLDRQPSNRNKLIAGGVALGLTTMAFLGVKLNHASNDIKDIKDELAGSDRSTSAPASFDPADTDHDGTVSELESAKADGIVTRGELDALSDPSQSEFVDPMDLVTAYTQELDDYRQATYDVLDSRGWLNSQQKAALEVPTNTATKNTWSNKMIMSALALDVADATLQESRKLGVAMMPTIMSPEVRSFDENRNNVGKLTPVNIYETDGVILKPKNGVFNGVENLSTNARVIYGRYVHNTNYETDMTPEIFMLVDLQPDRQGSLEAWRELGAWDANDPAIQAAVKALG